MNASNEEGKVERDLKERKKLHSNHIPSCLELTMLGQAEGGEEFSSKKDSTLLESDQIGNFLILPCYT